MSQRARDEFEPDCPTCRDTHRITLDAAGQQVSARRDEPTTTEPCPDCPPPTPPAAPWRELDDPWAATRRELDEGQEPF